MPKPQRKTRTEERVGKATLNFPTRQAGGQPQPTVVVGVRTSEVNAENSPLQCISSGRALGRRTFVEFNLINVSAAAVGFSDVSRRLDMKLLLRPQSMHIG